MVRNEVESGPTLRGVELVFSARVRWTTTILAVVVGAVIVAAAPLVPDTSDGYVGGLVVAGAPFATAGLWFTWGSLHAGPASYRPFWRWWFVAASVAYAAGAAALLGVVTHVGALLVVAVVLLVAAVPCWVVASVRMLHLQAGRRGISVDVLDGLTALAVLGAPAVLLGAEPVLRADHPAFVLPFLASIALAPAGLYLSFVGLARGPRGDRTAQGIALALGAAFSTNGAVQLAHVLSDFALGMPMVLLFQVLNMALLMAVPLWAHRHPTSVLADLPPEAQVRGLDPLAFVSAAVLPALAVCAWLTRDERPWGVAFVLGVLVVVVLLGAIRHAAQRRETNRLHAEIARVAEERRTLLTSMVRALEDDRANVAAELHSQAVESFAALGALIQTAYVTLPPDSARAVKEAISHAQHDLSTRAAALRKLTAALRPPAFDPPAGGGADATVLATALRAFVADAVDRRGGPRVHLDIDDDLVLDWSTTTIVYRIAQEAIANAASHARASVIDVAVAADGASIIVRVADDGAGFDLARTADGPGVTRMRLLAELGGGHVEIESGSGRGTVVRSVLAGGLADPGAAPRPGPEARPAPARLQLVHIDADEGADAH